MLFVETASEVTFLLLDRPRHVRLFFWPRTRGSHLRPLPGNEKVSCLSCYRIRFARHMGYRGRAHN